MKKFNVGDRVIVKKSFCENFIGQKGTVKGSSENIFFGSVVTMVEILFDGNPDAILNLNNNCLARLRKKKVEFNVGDRVKINDALSLRNQQHATVIKIVKFFSVKAAEVEFSDSCINTTRFCSLIKLRKKPVKFEIGDRVKVKSGEKGSVIGIGAAGSIKIKVDHLDIDYFYLRTDQLIKLPKKKSRNVIPHYNVKLDDEQFDSIVKVCRDKLGKLEYSVKYLQAKSRIWCDEARFWYEKSKKLEKEKIDIAFRCELLCENYKLAFEEYKRSNNV